MNGDTPLKNRSSGWTIKDREVAKLNAKIATSITGHIPTPGELAYHRKRNLPGESDQ